MDTIIFDSPFNRKVFIRSNTIFLNYCWRERKRQIIQWGGIALTFLALGLWIGIKEDELNNPYILISIFSASITVVMLLEMLFSLRRIKRKIEKTADEYERTNTGFTLKISNEGVYFDNFQAQINLKWSAFEHYTVYKDCIIIIPKNYISGGIIIDKQTDDLTKYDQALNILNDKLSEI